MVVQPFVEAGAAPSAPQGKDYLFDALIHRINQPSQQPLRWQLIVTVGQPSDPTNDATIAWPDNREHLDAATQTTWPTSSFRKSWRRTAPRGAMLAMNTGGGLSLRFT
jgi:catalase